ncbi:MAG: hypothetical protein LUF68_05750 [Clostridiales bacterium]|nr:hypothetical protein [Clostridiales bacterium]
MKRFFVSWVAILALVLSGYGKTAVSPDASGSAESQQSTAVEADVTAAEEEGTEKAVAGDMEETADSEALHR